MAAGLVIASRRWELALLFGSVFLFIYLPVIEQEEQHLRKLFPEFEDYAARVPLLFPLGRRADGGEAFRPALYGKIRNTKLFLAIWWGSPSWSGNRSGYRMKTIMRTTLGLLSASWLRMSVFAESRVSFNRDIRPIMADTCFRCHGPDKSSRMAGMRLDLRDEAVKPTKSGVTPIVPGKPDESAIIARIFSPTTAKIMPPSMRTRN